MSIDIQSWTSVTALIVSIIGLFPRRKAERTAQQQEALIALADAYHETEKYIEHSTKHGRDRDKEWDIARKWSEVAILLEPFDPNGAVYRRLGVKSRFWSEGATWDEKVIKEANIGLWDIQREVRLLLGERA